MPINSKNQFDNFAEAYRRGLAKMTDRLVWTKGSFSTFAGIMQTSKYNEAIPFAQPLGMKPTGKPFDVRRELEGVGGYELDVPVTGPLVAQGVQ
jgi:hypothetical protein